GRARPAEVASRSQEKASRAPKPAQKPRRKRRDAAEAREAILDAAEKRLARGGPASIRLQEVAADVGVSHPTVLHHFGSRELLMKAVIERGFATLHTELVAAIGGSTGGVAELSAMLEAVSHSLSTKGHGRMLLWLALEGHRVSKVDVPLSAVVDAAHGLRSKKRGGKTPVPPREDTAHVVVLAALSLSALSVMGPALLEQVGLANDAAGEARFRAWLAKVLIGHLDLDIETD
ncbi:MAG: TetR/AcrR family transcriptional regulator, partial [Polyangiaceae bacterium]